MKAEEIRNMNANTEMDALIARNIIGLEESHESGWWWVNGMMEECPDYSDNISDAWKVVEKLNSMGAWVSLSKGADNFTWDFRGIINKGKKNEVRFINHAETAPLAICRAALLAVMEFEE